jgi:circadian clock protein KaiB
MAMTATIYDLTLFVSGASDRSARAIADAKQLCDVHLAGRHRLAVVDVHEDAAAAFSSGVVVVPTLVRNLPLPVRKLAGDLSQTDKVLRSLELPDQTTSGPGTGSGA